MCVRVCVYFHLLPLAVIPEHLAPTLANDALRLGVLDGGGQVLGLLVQLLRLRLCVYISCQL
jgi:hypothetical protein